MSDLRARLGALRRQSGTIEPAAFDERRRSDFGAPRRQLERMETGRRPKASQRPRLNDVQLAAELEGVLVRDGVIGVAKRIPEGTGHGRYPIVGRAMSGGISFLHGGEGYRPASCVFMDTETTGLAGGTGTVVFLLGMAKFTASGFEVLQLFVTGFQSEAAMLQEAREWLRGADTLITFNGRSFDHPLLAARYRLAGLPDPFAELDHLDLLHPVRRTFRQRWPDCRLQTVESRLLGFERVDDLPGSEAPRVWLDWLRHGRGELLPKVFTHNRLDLISLAVLPQALEHCHGDPMAVDADPLACATHHARIAGEQTAYDFLRQRRVHLDVRAKLELARLARRREEWSLAEDLWQELAAIRVVAALEHLAKFYEHRQCDFERALQLTRQLIDTAPHEPRHRHRQARLLIRLQRKT